MIYELPLFEGKSDIIYPIGSISLPKLIGSISLPLRQYYPSNDIKVTAVAWRLVTASLLLPQVVIYLKQTASPLVYQTSFTMERTRHEFDVIRLWEQPASLFLQYPGLIPFAALGQSTNAEETLRQASQRIDQIEDPATQANLMAASGILAGLKLEDEIIYRVLRRDIMQESTVYRSIWRDAQKERDRAIALNFLRDGLSVEAVARGTGLSIEEVQQLQQ
jgi:predicted transposase YdaD